MQPVPHPCLMPVPQPPPAGHARAVEHLARQHFPRQTRAQNEHDPAQGLCCANRVRDSCRKSSVVAERHEQTVVQHLQNQELASLQRSAQARRFTALLTIWFDPDMSWDAAPSGEQGRQQTYSDPAIQTCLRMKVLFGMALRQTTGFVESLLRLVGLDWPVPDFSAMSRRQKTLAANIPYRGSKAFRPKLESWGFP